MIKRKILLALIVFTSLVTCFFLLKNTLMEKEEYTYKIITHGMGKIDGMISSNTKEGFEVSYENGNRLFDADIRFSRDNELILCHEWNALLGYFSYQEKDIYYDDLHVGQLPNELLPDKDEFSEIRIKGEYTPLCFSDVIGYMKEKTDFYIFLDIKTDIKKTLEKICLDCKNDPKLLDRMIPSVYHFEDVDIAKEIYPFKNIAIRQYENKEISPEEIVDFCKKRKVNIVNINYKYCTESLLSFYQDNNMSVFVAVINNEEELDNFLSMGASGIVSDDIFEDMVNGKR